MSGDYDFAAKEEYRETLWSAVASWRLTDLDGIAIILPEDGGEIPHAAEAGFGPDRLVCVDRDPSPTLDPRYVLYDLDLVEAAGRITETVSVLNMDLCNNFSTEALTAVAEVAGSLTLTEPAALIGLTLQKGREDPATVAALGLWAELAGTKEEPIVGDGGPAARIAALARVFAETTDRAEIPLVWGQYAGRGGTPMVWGLYVALSRGRAPGIRETLVEELRRNPSPLSGLLSTLCGADAFGEFRKSYHVIRRLVQGHGALHESSGVRVGKQLYREAGIEPKEVRRLRQMALSEEEEIQSLLRDFADDLTSREVLARRYGITQRTVTTIVCGWHPYQNATPPPGTEDFYERYWSASKAEKRKMRDDRRTELLGTPTSSIYQAEALRKELVSDLRAARKSRGLLQKNVAELLGVRKSTVGSWERAEAVPSAKSSRAIAELLEDPRKLDEAERERKWSFEGAELRAARKRLGLSQSSLARKLGVSRSAVGSWEKDRYVPGTDEIRRALVERLGLAD